MNRVPSPRLSLVPLSPLDRTVPPRSAYVHIPFCSHKCGYCDFASVAGRDEQMDEYLDALAIEMQTLLPEPATVDTIFIGGGTPTYLSATQLDRMLGIVSGRLLCRDGYEFTVESNPNTLTPEKVAVLASHGVNRVSLGAQSFHPEMLRQLERDHDPASVSRAIEMLRPHIGQVSIDLIFGVPGQTVSQWERDLDQMIRLDLDHCSAYGLTYEKGTLLWKQRKLGIVQPVDEELELAMLNITIDRLAEAGFEQYEISNYRRARSGSNPCRHNLTYWANDPYYGFGTGAAAFVAGVRSLNTRELDSYMTRCREGISPITQREVLEPEERARETAMLNLRRTTGLVRDQFQQQTGFTIDHLAGPQIAEFVAMGFLADDGQTLWLTRAGLPLADGIFARML